MVGSRGVELPLITLELLPRNAPWHTIRQEYFAFVRTRRTPPGAGPEVPDPPGF